MPVTVLAGIVGCVLLYCFNPTEIGWMPKCPFLALTGLKCPGCGTLRGIHFLLHLRFADAWKMNPFLLIALPLAGALLAMPRLSRNVVVSMVVTSAILLYWAFRNIAGF